MIHRVNSSRPPPCELTPPGVPGGTCTYWWGGPPVDDRRRTSDVASGEPAGIARVVGSSVYRGGFRKVARSRSPEGSWAWECARYSEVLLCPRRFWFSAPSFSAGSRTPWVVGHPGSEAQIPVWVS